MPSPPTRNTPDTKSHKTATHGSMLSAIDRSWMSYVSLFSLTLLTYSNVMTTGGFIWDDPEHVVNNVQLRDVAGLTRIWLEPTSIPQYYPLVHTMFWVEFHAWGLNAHGFHIVNVLIHAVNAVLLLRILKQLDLRGSWLCAALFAIHPVHVESVAWISERKNILSGFFYLLTTLCYLRFRPFDQQISDNGKHSGCKRGYVLALACYLCALLSKTVTASWPAALLVVVWWKTGRLRRSDWLPLLPFFALGLAAGLMTAFLERYHVGASGAEWEYSVTQRCLIAGRAVWFYAGKLFWPSPLVFFYPRWNLDSPPWWAYALPVSAVLLVLSLCCGQRRLGRGPLAAVLFFGGTLVPALGFVDYYPMIYSYVADHFQYLASMGLVVLAVNAWMCTATGCLLWAPNPSIRAKHSKKISEQIRLACAKRVVEIGVLGCLAILGWRQQSAYHNQEALWRDTIRKNPGAWMAHYNLAIELSEREQPVEAIAHYRKAIELKPDDCSSYNNWALALERLERLDEAVARHLDAVACDPDSAEYRYNLANLQLKRRELTKAHANYARAVELEPGYADAWSNFGIAEYYLGLDGQGDLATAKDKFQTALQIQPNHTGARGGANDYFNHNR